MAAQVAHQAYADKRLKRLRSALQELKLDAFVTLDPSNLRWLTGWSEVFDDEPAHLGLITRNKAYIHTDARYSEALRTKNQGGSWRIDDTQVGHLDYAQKILNRSRKDVLHLGYESNIRLDVYKALKKKYAKSNIKLKVTNGLCASLRAEKDSEEVRLLRKAQSITDAAFSDLLSWIEPGMRELEVANRLDFTLRDKGAEALAFDTIAASGPNSALPHARPTTRRLRRGDFVTLDFGARYKDYCADMTRTLFIGKATGKQRHIYEAVLAAHQNAKACIKAGVTGKEAHEFALETLKEQELDTYFTHALGHGVGIEVHEQPSLSPLNDKELHVGNVVTVEPGVYLPGFGGVRIEDCGLVGETSFKSFAKSPRELIEIPA